MIGTGAHRAGPLACWHRPKTDLQLLPLGFSGEDESEASLVDLELATRSAYKPQAIQEQQAHVPKMMKLYEAVRME